MSEKDITVIAIVFLSKESQFSTQGGEYIVPTGMVECAEGMSHITGGVRVRYLSQENLYTVLFS